MQWNFIPDVNDMNDSPTRQIGMSRNNTIKLEHVHSKPSTKYYCPIGADEPQLPKGTIVRFLLAPDEWENDPFEYRIQYTYIK
ncbi:hypothetical protein Glove_543g80 [Diversispora epigaea]|uniref:Uncharacterized protein n=1 Tax=Diversispora epigaea TaxID=1348612 RepID=A0A397GL49_9GLOM|nr:hypothetical protein Glove_543g80 [Diversispora epigaea]